MSRTYKKEYTGSKRFDRSCRSHGDCPWCQANRTISTRREEVTAREEMGLCASGDADRLSTD